MVNIGIFLFNWLFENYYELLMNICCFFFISISSINISCFEFVVFIVGCVGIVCFGIDIIISFDIFEK